MEASLHGKNVHTAKLTEDQLAAVALDGGYGEIGDVGIREFRLVSYF